MSTHNEKTSSPELAKQLRAVGVIAPCGLYWVVSGEGYILASYNAYVHMNALPAYTVGELWALVWPHVKLLRTTKSSNSIVKHYRADPAGFYEQMLNSPDHMAELLIFLLELAKLENA